MPFTSCMIDLSQTSENIKIRNILDVNDIILQPFN